MRKNIGLLFSLNIQITTGRVIQQLLCALIIWTITACTSMVDHNSETNSNWSETESITNGDIPLNEENKIINTPSNLVDVLKNINSSITQHLLLNDSFFVDENLYKMFGAGKIERMPENNLEKKSISFIAADKLMGVSINIWKTQSQPLVTNIIINIYSNEVENPFFEEIEKIYGINWNFDKALEEQYVRQHDRVFKKSVHKLGNRAIFYRYDDVFSKSKIAFELDFDGRINAIYVSQGGQ